MKALVARVTNMGDKLAEDVKLLPDVKRAQETSQSEPAGAALLAEEPVAQASLSESVPAVVRRRQGAGRRQPKHQLETLDSQKKLSWEGLLGKEPLEGEVLRLKSSRGMPRVYTFREGKFINNKGKELVLERLRVLKNEGWTFEWGTETPVVPEVSVGTEDFVVTPNGHIIVNLDEAEVRALIHEEGALAPPAPAAPAEEYSPAQIARESGVSEEEVLNEFSVRMNAEGELEPDPQTQPTPVLKEKLVTDEQEARELIRTGMEAGTEEVDGEDENIEGSFLDPGTKEAEAVLRSFGRLPATEAKQQPEQEASNLDELIKELDAARKQYVAVDLEKSSTLLRLRNFFGLKQGISTEDIDDARAQYDSVRTRYMQARLAEVEKKYAGKTEAVTREQYKKEMAETLNFSEFEGRVKLYEARKQADIEKRAGSLAGRITEKAAEWLHAYNKLKWYEKLAIGGALVGVAAAGSAVGGTAAFGTAVGVALSRGMLSGGALAVGLDTTLEARADAKAKKRVEENEKRLFQKISELETMEQRVEPILGGQSEAEKMEAFTRSLQGFSDAYLKNQSEIVKFLFEERRDGMKRRKFVAGAAGVAMGVAGGNGWFGSAFQYVREHGVGISWVDKALHFAAANQVVESVKPQEAGALPTSTVDSHQVGIDITKAQSGGMHDIPKAGASQMPTVENAAATPKVSGLPFSSEYQSFLKPVTVRSGDNFWNLVKARTGGLGLDEGRSRYLIDLIKDKAATLSPKEVRALGIASGDISKLQPGDHIDFTRLFGTKDLDSYLSQAKGISYATTQSVLEHTSDSIPAAERNYMKIKMAEMKAVIAATPTDVTPAPVKTVVTEAIAQEGVVSGFSPEYAPRVNDWYSQIFRVENPSVNQDIVFSRSEIMKLKVMDVVKDMKALDAGQLSGYKSGLAPEQYRNFYKFAESMQKSGILSMTEFLRGNVNGTVEDYLKMAAPRATRGTLYGLFSTSQ